MNRTVFATLLLAVLGLSLAATPTSAREQVKPGSANPQAQKLIDQAWTALDHNMGLPEIDRAIQALEAALALDPDNPQLLTELAGQYFQRGYQMPAADDAQIAARKVYFQKGYDTAAQALALKPSAGAHAWCAANLGSLKQFDGIMAQAASLPEIKEHVDWIAAHEPDYGYCYPARFWTGALARSPGAALKMMGQDPDQILINIDAAMARNPGYLENYLFKAEFLQSVDKTDEALKLLDHIIAADPAALPAEQAQNRLAQQNARDFWKQWTGKERPNR